MAKAGGQAVHRGVGQQGTIIPVAIPATLRSRRRDRRGLLGTTALQAVTVLVLAQPALAQLAPTARPTGGQVVGGQVGISQSTQTTTVQQSSQHGAINWQSYNIGASHTVQYLQPNAQASTLNRVVGPDPSVIAGKITANGNVVLVNQSGVVFEKGAQVDVQGLIVTSNNIRTADFMAGRMNFDQPGNPNARVVNHGSITVRESGLAALVAPSVANHGVINARMGKVVLAGATAHTVDLYGDGLIAVDVTGQVKQVPVGPDGKAVTALVTNTGTILADGGTVQLTARAVDGIVGNLVTAGGRIQANSVGNRAGRIDIAGVGGGLTIEGDIAATGIAAGTKGGSVQALATGDVTVRNGARIDVSGHAGGGTVAIGTTLDRAAGPVVKNAPMAARVSVEEGATLAADATVNGKGGSIVMLAAGTTRMNGSATARGGAVGGDGGFVEISGKTLSSITGKVDVTAPHGKNGSILIDPDFLTIVNGPDGTGNQDPGFSGVGTVAAGTTVGPDTALAPDTISNGAIQAFAGDVILQANQTLTVAANVSLPGAGNTLSLEAGGTITVNTGVVITVNGDVFLGTGGATNGKSGAPPAAQPSPLISVLGSVQSTAGAVTLNSGTGGVVNVGAAGSIQAGTTASLTGTVVDIAGTVVAPNVTAIASTGTIGLIGTIDASINTTLIGIAGIAGSTGRVIGGGVLLALSNAGTIDLSGANNAVSFFSGIGSGGTLIPDRVLFANTTAFNLGDVTAAGTATVEAPTIASIGTVTAPTVTLTANAGTLDLTGVINATDVNLTGSTGITGVSGVVNASGSLSATSAAGGVDLSNAANQVANASGSAATDFLLTSGIALNVSNINAPTSATITATDLTVSGTVTAATVQLAAGSGTLTLNGTVDAAGAAILIGAAGIAGSTGRVVGEGVLVAIAPGGDIILDNANNAIASVALLSAGGVINLVDTNALVLGPASAGTSISVNAGTLTVNDLVSAPIVGMTASAGTLTLTSTGTVNASTSASLSGQAGIDGAAGTIIGNGALTAVSALGDVDLSNVNNAVASAAGSAAGAFTIVDTGALDLGTVTSGTTVTATAETLSVTGTVTGPTTNLTATVGTLTLTGTVDATLATLLGEAGISGATGRIIGGGTVIANSAAGSVDLSNITNDVAMIGGTAALSFAFSSGSTLTLDDITATGGNVALRSADPGGIIFGAGKAVTSVSGGRVSLRADQLINLGGGGTGSVNIGATGTLEIAPETLGAPMSLGSLIVGTLSIETLAGFTAGRVVFGSATDIGGTSTTTAGSIAIGGTGFDLATGVVTPSTLTLSAIAAGGGTGDVGQSAPLLNVGTLTGSAQSFTLTDTTNAVSNVSGLTAVAGATLTSGVDLSVGGVTAGTEAVVTAPTLTVDGTVAASIATLVATAGTLAVTNTGAVIAPTAFLSATAASLILQGTIDAGTVATLTGATGIDGSTGRIIGGGSVIANAGTGDVDLAGTNNQIGSVTGTASGAFLANDLIALDAGNITAGTTASINAPTLTASGSIIAPTISLTASTGTLGVTGKVDAGTIAVLTGPTISVSGLVIAPTASLTASVGTLSITGTVDAKTAVLSGQAGIAAATGLILGSSTVTATSGGGAVVLSNTGNEIVSATGTASAGFTVVSGVDLALGDIGAGTTASASAPNLTAGGSISAVVANLAATSGLLSVTGTVNATTQAIGTGPTVSVGGTVIAPSTTLTASSGTLTLTGTVDASIDVALSGQSGIAGASGHVIGGGSLSAIAAGGDVDLSNTNNAVANASGNALGNFALVDSIDLNLGNVSGTTVNVSAPNLTATGTAAGGAVSLTATAGTLAIPGVVDAAVEAVGTAPTITVAGTVIGPTTSLTATAGTLGLTGTVNASIAAILSGQAGIAGAAGVVIGGGALTATSAGGAVDLTNPANAVASAAGSALTNFLLVDTGSLDLGNVTAGTLAAISTGELTASGTVIAPTVSLTATSGTLGLTGVVDASTAAVLSASDNIVGPAGLVIGDGALTATSGGGAVDLSNAGNVVASVTGGADSSFALTNSVALDVGTVAAGTSITIAAPTLTASGAVSAPTVALTAGTGTLGVTGAITASILATLSGNAGVVGPTGTILGGGALNVSSAAGSVDLTNAANVFASLEGSAANTFQVTDSTALGILTGKSVTANTVTITATNITNDGTVTGNGTGTAAQLIASTGSIANTGLVQAPTGATSLTAVTGITSSGTVSAGGAGSAASPSVQLATTGGAITQSGGLITATNSAGYVSLQAPGGAIGFAGTISAGAGSPATGTVDVQALTTVTETAGTGVLVTGVLSGSAGGAVTLNSTPGNRIASVGSLSAGAGLALSNSRDLTLSGPVTVAGGPVTIAVKAGDGTTGILTNTGTVAATSPTAGSMTLTADGGIVNATGGVITGAGPAASPSVALTSGAAITNAAGATITATNTISGSVALTAATDITSAGTITAAGTFAGISSVAMTAGGTIAQGGGVISATHVAGSAALNAGSIDLAGTVAVGGSLSLVSSGRITQGGGTAVGTATGAIIAGLLTGSSGTTTTLGSINNQIGTIGPFNAANSLVLRNGTANLTVAGALSVTNNGTLLLQNGVTGGSNNLTLATGSRLQAGTVALLAPGVIEGRGATIAATTLTLPSGATGSVGAGTGVASVRQAILGDPTASDPVPINSIGTLGAVTASESLVLMDATALLLAGDIFAPTIRIGSTGAMTIADGVTATTGGAPLTLPPSSTVPPDTDATSGFNIALLASTGTIDLGKSLTIQSLPGVSQPTFRIALTQGGEVVFGDLLAPATNVILHVGTGTASSKPGTNIDVANLFVFYRTGAPSVSLTGKVAGQTASGAAAISRIGRESTTSAFGQTPTAALQFDPSALYQINQCSITAVNCVLTATLQIPPLLPLQVLYHALPVDVLDDPDMLLPLISEQDE